MSQWNFTPRPHQAAGVKALIDFKDGRFSVAEVTVAGGKSNMLAMLAWHYSQFGRVIIVAHNAELVKHNAAACAKVGIKPGVCSSSIATNAFARVTVGTVGSIVNRWRLFKDVVAILVDEVHMVPPAASSQYRKLFEYIPQAKVHGLTGTPFRADGTGDLAKTFGPIAFRFTFLDALLNDPPYVKPIVPVEAGEDETIDVEQLRTKGQDYDLEEQAARAILLAPSHVKTLAETMQRFGRKRCIIFCCNTAHVDEVERVLAAAGQKAVGIHSNSVSGKRAKGVQAFEQGFVNYLVSCNMFNTGFDVPDIDLMCFMRATKSAVYYAQGLGRGARLSNAAANCLLLDFGGNLERHGALDAVQAAPGRVLTCEDVTKEETGCGEEWETWEFGKTCPGCKMVHKTATKCKECQKRFDPFHHGMTCPHCGQDQRDIKECAACGEKYAAFMHPICPHCEYDNTTVMAPGKDLKTRGSASEAVSIKAIIEKSPWQEIMGPPVKIASGWQLTTKFTQAKWPYDDLPDISHAYLTRMGNGQYRAQGVRTRDGKIIQR